MKDLIIPVNNEALARALIAVAGEEQTKLIVTAYGLIDQAMVFGYEKSQAEEADKRKKMAEDYVAALERSRGFDEAPVFKAGYDAGFSDADIDVGEQHRADQQESYDDGYVDGVADARAFPDFADDQVSLLCAADEATETDEGSEYDFEDYEGADWYHTWDPVPNGWDVQEYNDSCRPI